MSSLEKRLWDSDDSSPLTHEAAREIERLNWMIQSCTSRAEAAEAECGRLRLVVEFLTDELSKKGKKIVELDREVGRLQKSQPW